MKIECLTTFLNGRDRFEAGDVRTVQDEDGAQFVANGWAKSLSGQPATAEPAGGSTDLDIQSSTMNLGDHHG